MVQIPLLSIKSFTDFSPLEYIEYVKSLYEDPNKGKKVSSDLNFRVNEKGTPIITVRNRKPKWITPQEIDTLAEESGYSKREMWLLVGRKDIEVRRSDG